MVKKSRGVKRSLIVNYDQGKGRDHEKRPLVYKFSKTGKNAGLLSKNEERDRENYDYSDEM